MKGISKEMGAISWRPLLVIFLLVAALGILGLPSMETSLWAKSSEITILHTNNVTGHLFGCPT
jgi:hypothetical protein